MRKKIRIFLYLKILELRKILLTLPLFWFYQVRHGYVHQTEYENLPHKLNTDVSNDQLSKDLNEKSCS